MITVKLDLDIKGIANLEEDAKLLQSKKVHVGILSDSVNGKSTNAQIAEANEREFGWITGLGTFVPPRSTIRLPLEMKEEEIREAAIKEIHAIDEESVNNAFEALGRAALQAIHEAFDSQGFGQWEGNAPSVVARKGKNSPMVDKGNLKQAYSYEVVDGSET